MAHTDDGDRGLRPRLRGCTVVLRKLFIAVFALLVVPVIVAVEAMVALSRPRLPADPGFDVASVVGAEHPGDPLVVHVIGDSTIAGVGVDRESDSLPYRIAVRTADELERPIRVVGHGVSGATTDEVLEQLDDVPQAGIDAIVVEVGSNDVTHRRSLDRVERDTRALLRAALDRTDTVVFGSAGKLDTPIFWQPLRAIIVRRATAVRARQRSVAEELDVPFVDVGAEVGPGFERAGPKANGSDGFHPSALGYDIWAVPMAARLAEALRDA